MRPADQIDHIRIKRGFTITKMLIGIFVVMGLLFFGLALYSGSSLQDLVLPAIALGGMWLFALLLIGSIEGFRVMSARRGAQEFLEAEPWVRWQYSPDEWRAFAETSATMSRKTANAGLMNLFTGPLLGGVIIAAGFFTGDPKIHNILFIIGAGVIVLVGG